MAILKAKKGGGEMTPVPPGFVKRAIRGIVYTITGADSAWFGPLQPLEPLAQEVKGRALDYVPGYNLNVTQRPYEPVSFDQMRALAYACDVLRLVIETRKDQVARMQWRVKIKEEEGKADKAAVDAAKPRIKKVTALLKKPDGEHTFEVWLRTILEDMFVCDAATVYPRPTLGGGVYSLEVIDGATIVRKINPDGRTPVHPDVAYQQLLHGVPAVDYTAREILYRPRNLRSNHIYGYSPVEQVITAVNIALRRQLFQLSYYTEGNVPEALCEVPPEWTADQIREWQIWWDELMEGNLAQRRHMRFVPGGMKLHETKAEALKDAFDEWLARIICYCFSVSPQPFIKEMNRATAQTSAEQTQEEGLEPILNWVKALMDEIIENYLNEPDLEFVFEEENEVDPEKAATINDLKVKNGSRTLDEIRADDGLDPYPNGLGAKPMIYTATGPVLLENVLNPPEPPPAVPGSDNPTDEDGDGGDGNKVKEDEQEDNQEGQDKGGKAASGGGKIEKADAKGKKKASKKGKVNIKPIDRNRKTVKAARKKIAALFQKAFEKAKAKVMGLDFGLAKVDEEIKAKARKILAEVDFQGWSVINEDDIEEILAEVTKDGTIQALLQIGMSEEDLTSTMSAKAVEYAEQRAATLVADIEESTREMLRADVTKAMEEGWSNDRLADELEKNYAFSDSRSEMIARTETAMADVEGNMTAYKESGVVEGKEWITGSDADCEECGMNQAKGVIPLDDTFPSGDDAPPAHPNCVCDILPVLTEEGEE